MLRNMVLLTILALAVPTVSEQQKPTGQQDARKSQRDAKQVDVPAAPITNNQATSYYEQPRENKPQGWHKLVTWPEGITAWAIMFTLGAIIWQAWETRVAAIAAKDSIKLQEAAMKQWVELVDWKSQVLTDGRFEISFSLLNPTNFLIVLICAEVRFKPKLPEMYSLVRTGSPLPPKTHMTFKLNPPIGEPALQTFKTGQQMGIVIEGLIVFRSALEEVVTQEFSGPVLCSLAGTTLESTMTLRAAKGTKEKRKKES
jgi:hypothetical protein